MGIEKLRLRDVSNEEHHCYRNCSVSDRLQVIVQPVLSFRRDPKNLARKVAEKAVDAGLLLL